MTNHLAQLAIHFTDTAGWRAGTPTPPRKAKPTGVLGAEIWVKGGVGVLARESPIGQPTPNDPDTIRFVALDTQTPYTLDFDAADGGKNAHYLLRWVNPTGQIGPWNETATVTVGA